MATRVEHDEPLVTLVNMILVTMIREGETCVRVRTDAEPAVQTYGAGGWGVLETFSGMPSQLREPVIERLESMAEIPLEATLTFRGSFRLTAGKRGGTHTFDVSFSRAAAGSAIVLVRTPAPEDVPSDAERVRRASILLSHAEDATARDDALRLVRQATALVPEGDGERGFVLSSAAAICGEAGLYDECRSLLALALPLAREARVRAQLEQMIGVVYRDTHRLDDAVSWYRRALATAEGIPGPPVHGFAPLLGLAEVATERSDLDAAERWLARAEALASDLFGGTSAAFVCTRAARAGLTRAHGDAASAEAIATRALEDARRYELAHQAERLLHLLADFALARGDAAAAVAHVRSLLDVPSRSPTRAHDYALLARAQRSLGRESAALSALRAASALAEGALAPDHPVRVDVERELALLGATSPYRS